jgi:hypothetical protein
MKFSRELFWGVNYDTIDWEKNYLWVIYRVLDCGGIEDFRAARKHYGDEKIVEAATEAKSLDIKTIHFIHHIFDVPLERFKCQNKIRVFPSERIY